MKEEFKFYGSCKYLPIFNYYEILETTDYRYLLKLNDYEYLPENINDKELKEIWEKINLEYSDLKLADAESRMIFITEKQVNRLKYEYQHIQMLLDYLQHGWDNEIVKMLGAYPSFMGAKYKVIKQKPLFQQLEKIQKQSKNYINQIKHKEHELKNLKPNDDDKGSKQTFEQIAAILSKFVGYHINTKKTTVVEWEGISKNYIKHMENGKRS